MPKKIGQELKLLNDLWRIIQWMSEVPENEKSESKAFRKAFSQLQRAYPTNTPKRKEHKLITAMKQGINIAKKCK